ncbi:MAG: DUF4199 domain-containing protein [Prevotellaceae bacterium]|nr:DUF4199 domain-containing protein [Prevotellaceae bacterium]
MRRYILAFGSYLGAFWIFKFFLFSQGLKVPFFSFLYVGLTLCVPFVAYRMVRSYRDRAQQGVISFGQAWLFTTALYVIAAILTAVIYYIYFRYINQYLLVDYYKTLFDAMLANPVPEGMQFYADQIDDMAQDAIAAARALTPVDITLKFLSRNVIAGLLLAIPTALIVMRRKKNFDEPAS